MLGVVFFGIHGARAQSWLWIPDRPSVASGNKTFMFQDQEARSSMCDTSGPNGNKKGQSLVLYNFMMGLIFFD